MSGYRSDCLMVVDCQLIDDYPTDADVKRLVDTYDWYFTPVSNPDGYVYTWNSVKYRSHCTLCRHNQTTVHHMKLYVEFRFRVSFKVHLFDVDLLLIN